MSELYQIDHGDALVVVQPVDVLTTGYVHLGHLLTQLHARFLVDFDELKRGGKKFTKMQQQQIYRLLLTSTPTT